MIRKIRVDIEITWSRRDEVEYFEVKDDDTEIEMAEETPDIFLQSSNLIRASSGSAVLLF